MYISKIKLQNFRCYAGIRVITFSKGINFLVGDNNCGKTTIFKALDFLITGKSKEGWISENVASGDVSVEIVLTGDDLPVLFENSDLKKFHSYVSQTSDGYQLTLRRSSKITTWNSPRGKKKEITIKNISLYNPKTKQYENPTGADSVPSALFEPQFVYSDLNNEEYRDFGKTKIVGKLLNEVTEMFHQSDSWTQLEESHRKAFGEDGFSSKLRALEESIEGYMQDQYGKVKVQFDFSLPGIDSFLKTGQILLEDNGIRTDVAEKGTGMQRALAMSLIQVYAQNVKEKNNSDKSLLFFLDEPETFLHPRAQDRLLGSLEKLSEHTQIFITTHSPYLLKNYNKNHTIRVFSREDGKIKIDTRKELNLFPSGPTWGEINYAAFGVVSEEFHIELFGYLHNKAIEKELVDKQRGIQGFDDWLAQFLYVTRTDENHVNRSDKTMTCYIRNCIDHPGNHDDPACHRPKPTRDEIRTSIEEMLKVHKELKTSKNLPVEPQFLEKKRREALKRIQVEETDDLSLLPVLYLSLDAATFTEQANQLNDVTKRAAVEKYDPFTSYLLYIDKASDVKEIPLNRYIIIEKDYKPTPGTYGLFVYNNEVLIRKYVVMPAGIKLMASTKSKNVILNKEEDFTYLGTVSMNNKKVIVKE